MRAWVRGRPAQRSAARRSYSSRTEGIPWTFCAWRASSGLNKVRKLRAVAACARLSLNARSAARANRENRVPFTDFLAKRTIGRLASAALHAETRTYRRSTKSEITYLTCGKRLAEYSPDPGKRRIRSLRRISSTRAMHRSTKWDFKIPNNILIHLK